MKKILFLYFSLLCFSQVCAQNKTVKLVVRDIPANKVPQAVQNTHRDIFASYTTNKWEVHRAGGNIVKYVAVIKNNNIHIRSRYRLNGEHISYTQYYGKNLPDNIKQQITQDYPDFNILGGQKNVRYSTEIFRVRLARSGQKSIVYLNNYGLKMNAKDVPSELQEEDNSEEE